METSGIVVFTLWYIALAVLYIAGEEESLRTGGEGPDETPQDLRDPADDLRGKREEPHSLLDDIKQVADDLEPEKIDQAAEEIIHDADDE